MFLCRLAFGPHLGPQLAWLSAFSQRAATDRFRSELWSVSINVEWLLVVPNAAFEALHSVRGHVAVLSQMAGSAASLARVQLLAEIERVWRLRFGWPAPEGGTSTSVPIKRNNACCSGPFSAAQKLAQLDVGQLTTRRGVGRVNDVFGQAYRSCDAGAT
jgi:hypothetical protein